MYNFNSYDSDSDEDDYETEFILEEYYGRNNQLEEYNGDLFIDKLCGLEFQEKLHYCMSVKLYIFFIIGKSKSTNIVKLIKYFNFTFGLELSYREHFNYGINIVNEYVFNQKIKINQSILKMYNIKEKLKFIPKYINYEDDEIVKIIIKQFYLNNFIKKTICEKTSKPYNIIISKQCNLEINLNLDIIRYISKFI